MVNQPLPQVGSAGDMCLSLQSSSPLSHLVLDTLLLLLLHKGLLRHVVVIKLALVAGESNQGLQSTEKKGSRLNGSESKRKCRNEVS